MPFRSFKHLCRPLALAALYQAFALFWAGLAAWIFAWFGGSGPFEFFIIAANFTAFFIAFCDRECASVERRESANADTPLRGGVSSTACPSCECQQ